MLIGTGRRLKQISRIKKKILTRTKRMNSEKPNVGPKALVSVYEDMETAAEAVKALSDAGFSTDKIELVTHDLHEESPDVETPKVHETTTSSLIDDAGKWGAVGAGSGAAAGLLAAVLTGFPGIVIGMIIMGGVTGAIMGGMAGIEHAEEDDAVNLPTPDEYEQLLHNGHKLVVVHGTHEEMMQAKDVISHLAHIHRHLHPLHGHEFHEHPSHE
jgi:hypothetical protein